MKRTCIGLALLLLFAPGCTYSLNRGRDFAEIFRLQGGLGRGLGVTASAVGLLHVGLNTPGQFPHASGGGLVYGDFYFLSGGVSDVDFMRVLHDETLCVDHDKLEYFHSHKCWAVLPAVFSRVDTIEGPTYPKSEDQHEWIEGPWLWSREALDANPWAHVHAFDAELGVYLLFFNAKAGVSPGETLDFLLGIFTIDIARDDRNGSDKNSTEGGER
jgi:hypothetical protein